MKSPELMSILVYSISRSHHDAKAFGAFVAGEPWGPSMNDAVTFVHELGHTQSGFMVRDPLNVALSENPYRLWMGLPTRDDYAVLSQGQSPMPVPLRMWYQ